MTRDEFVKSFRERTGHSPSEDLIKKYADGSSGETNKQDAPVVEEKTQEKEQRHDIAPVGSIFSNIGQGDDAKGMFDPYIDKATNSIYDSLKIKKPDYSYEKTLSKPDQYIHQFGRAILPEKAYADFVAREKFKKENPNDESVGVFDALGLGMDQGVVDNFNAGASGQIKDRNKEYQLNKWTWNDVTSGKIFSQKMAKDLAYITGKTLADLPVIIGLNALLPGSGFWLKSSTVAKTLSPFAAGAAYGALDVATDKSAHGEEIKSSDVTKGALLNSIPLGVGRAAGEAVKFGSKALVGVPVKAASDATSNVLKDVPVLGVMSAINNKVLPKGIDYASKGLGYGTTIGVMEKTQAKMEGRETSPLGLISNMTTDAALRIGGNVIKTDAADTSPEVIHEREQILGERSQDNPVIAENAAKYVEKAGGNAYDAIQMFSKDYRNVIDSLYNGKKKKGTEAFAEAKNREDAFKAHVKEIENQTGKSTGILDADGNIKDKKILMSRKELGEAIEQGWEDGVESFIVDDPAKHDMIQEQILLNEYLRHVNEDTTPLNKNLQTEIGNRSKFMDRIKEGNDIDAYNRRAEKLLNNSGMHIDDIKEVIDSLNLTTDEMKKLAQTMNYYRPGKLAKMAEKFRIGTVMYGQKLGAAVEKSFMRPMRIINNHIRVKELGYGRELGKLNGKLNNQQRKEADAYIVSVQKKNDSKGNLVPIGEELLADLKAAGHLKDADIKTYDQLSPDQKAYVEHIFKGNREIWEIYNNARELMGQERIKGVGHEHVPLYNKDGSIHYLQDRDMMPWFIKENMEKSDIKIKDQKQRVDPKNIDFNIAGAVMAYRDFMMRQAIASPLSAKMQEFSKYAKAEGHVESADYLNTHAKYLAGEYIDTSLDKMVKKYVPTIMRNAYTALLSFNIKSIIGNATSFATTMAEFGIERTIKAAERVLDYKLGISNNSKIELSKFIETAVSNPEYDMMLMNINNKGFKKGYDKVTTWGTSTMRFFDLVNRSVTFETAYDFYKSKGWKDTDARWKADNDVARLQASGDRADTPGVMRGMLGRFVLSFGTYPITYLNYVTSSALGIEPIYKYVENFKTKEEADTFAKSHKGYETKETQLYNRETGKPLVNKDGEAVKNYIVYNKTKVNESFQGMWKLAVLGVLAESINLISSAIEEETPLKMSNINPGIIGSMVEAYTGKNLYQHAKQRLTGREVEGKHKAIRKIQKKDGSYRQETQAERVRRTIGKGVQEVASAVPLVGSLLNYGDGTTGAVPSMVNKVGKDIGKVIEYGDPLDMAKTVNDSAALFGWNFYKPLDYAISIRKEYLKDMKEKAADSRKHKKHDDWSIGEIKGIGTIQKIK